MIRCKTVEYSFDTRTTSLAGSTRFDFSSQTIYIPETTSRTFVNVTVEIQCRENDATGGTNSASRLIGIKLGAVAFNDVTKSEAIAQTFSPVSYRWTRDVTAYFVTNFGSGTSQTCQVGYSHASQSVQTLTAKLYITYTYDDAVQTTRVKTVKIPIESPTAMLTNTLTETGTNQVPVLTGGGSPFLPESSITVRDLWFEVSGSDGSGSTTDFGMELSLDAEAGVSQGTWEKGQNAGCPCWFFTIWRRTDMTTTSAHAFKLRATTTSRVAPPSIVLVVTYEYDHDASGTILNSLDMLLPAVATRLGTSDGATELFRSTLPILVQEPGTITLKQSGVSVYAHNFAWNAVNLLVRAGAQSFRTYTYGTDFQTVTPEGPMAMMQRIDSGGAQGAGLTLARGENTLTLDVYTSDSSGDSTQFSVFARTIINYTSGKHELGADAHAHTTRWLLKESERTTSTIMLHTFSYSHKIPEAHYWVNAIGSQSTPFIGGAAPSIFHIEVKTGERDGGGWINLAAGQSYDNKNVVTWYLNDLTSLFTRHPMDPSASRLQLNRTRRFRAGVGFLTPSNADTSCITDFMLWITYSAMAVEMSRGVNPAVNGMTIYAARSDTGDRVYSAGTTEAGNFSYLAHSDVQTLFNETYQNGAYSGRSFDYTPSGFGYNYKWTPTALSGLALWLRADLGVTTAGGAVSAVTDQSGAGNNAAQGTGGSQPTNTLDGGDNLPVFSFDGVADLLEVADASSIGSTAAFSAALWARPAAFPTDGTMIAQWGATKRFLMRVETGGVLTTYVSDGSGDTYGSVSAGLVVSKWYHFAFTYDGAGTGNAGRLKVYINGVLQTLTFTGTIPAASGNPTTLLSIGSKNAASTYFSGYLDGIIFINGRALTQDEVISHWRYRPRFG